MQCSPPHCSGTARYRPTPLVGRDVLDTHLFTRASACCGFASHLLLMKRAHESHEMRSMRKKTEKLQQCTREVEQQIEEIEAKRKDIKRTQQKSADQSKTEFLRAAAALQRKIDDNNEEAQRLQAIIDREQPELMEARQRLSEQVVTNQEKRAALEKERRERLAAINDEVATLRQLEADMG